MADEALPLRTLRTSVCIALPFVLIYAFGRQLDITVGLLIGTAISVGSLYSIMVVVPRLCNPCAGNGRAWMAAASLVKLPLLAGVLAFAMSSRYVDHFSVFLGAAIVPTVLVLKVTGHMLVTKLNSAAGEDRATTA